MRDDSFPSELLRHRAETYEALLAGLNEAGEGLFIVEAGTNRIVYHNEALARIYGYSHEEMEHVGVLDLIPPDAREHVAMRIRRHAAGEELPASHRATLQTRSGRRVSVEYTIRTIRRGEGTHLLGIVRDISARERFAERARDSEARHRAISELVSDVAYALRPLPDGALPLEWTTDAFQRITGYEARALTDFAMVETLVVPDHRAIFRAHLDKVRAGRADVCEFRIRTRSGGERWIRAYARPAPEAPGSTLTYGAATDITDEMLALSRQAELAAIVESSTDAIFGASPDGTITSWNAAAAELFGHTAGEVIGRRYPILVPTHRSQEATVILERIAAGERSRFDTEGLRKDGSIIPIELTVSPLLDAARRVVGGSMIAHDITERKVAEEAFRESEERFRSVFLELPLGLVLLDPEMRVFLINAGFSWMTGFEHHELATRPFADLFHPADAKKVRRGLGKVLVGERSSYQVETRMVRADGQIIWIRLTVSLVRHRDGSPMFGLCVVDDVTERKVAEEALRESEERFRRLAENAQDVIYRFRVRPDPGIEYVSPAATTISGYAPEEFYADHRLIFDRLHPADRAMLETMSWTSDSLREPIRLRWIREDGSILWTEMRTTAIHDDEGNLVAVEGIARDITQQIALEQELTSKNEELAEQYRRASEASRLKSEFLANMSHELRTPLTSIIGFTELLLGSEAANQDEAFIDHLGRVRGNAAHLLELINDLLDMAQIEAGKLRLRPEPVDGRAIARKGVEALQALADRKRIRVDLEIDNCPDDLVLDPARLTQVLFNYLSNAIKFTGEGGHVVVRMMPAGTDQLRLEVQDDGIGISPQDLGRLFVEFEQLDSSRAKRHQGTGLGLALVRRIVEAQAGRVGVESELGRGALFFAQMPRDVTIRDGRDTGGGDGSRLEGPADDPAGHPGSGGARRGSA